MTERVVENLNAKWTKVYSYGFGGVGLTFSMLTILLMFIYLRSPSNGGGLGHRHDGTAYFNWHPLLMSCAILLFMTPATSAFEVYAMCCSRARNKKIHASLQSLAVMALAAGYIIIYDCHTGLSDIGLATSVHSIAGYLTISLVALTYIMGFYLYVLKCGGSLRGELKPFHKRLGMMSLFMGYATLLMGFTENIAFNESTPAHTVHFAQVIVAFLIATAVCIGFAIVKFVDKKDSDDKYETTDDAFATPHSKEADLKVQLL